MDWQDWGFAFFMADNERRLAKEEAQREQERLMEEYDQWCIDHGIPPPRERNLNRSLMGAAASQWRSLWRWLPGGWLYWCSLRIRGS
jgi:hypothetical protein